MRCPVHAERVAEVACAICGSRYCADCAPVHPFMDEPVCGACAPAVARRVVDFGRQTHAGPPARRLLTGLGAFVLASVVVFAAVTLLSDPPADQDGAHLRDAYAAIEAVALALESFRAREGRYPEDLPDLVPQDLERLPADPYADGRAPLVYASSSSGAAGRLLYSVGPDRIDQGGQPMDPLTGRGDILYPVW